MKKGEILYKIDQNDNVRVWWMEYNENSYRVVSGVQGGSLVTSGWKFPTEKNVGKKNATLISEQVRIEVDAIYAAKLYQGKYSKTIEEAKAGPKFIECMLAEKYSSKKHQNFPYFSQPKYDGLRCLVTKDIMQSRNGKLFVSSPHIQRNLQSFFEQHPEVILDGELYNHDLKYDFEKIISLARKTKPSEKDLRESEEKIYFYVYDVIFPFEETFEKRFEFLQEHIQEKYEKIVLTDTTLVNTKEEIDNMMNVYLESGYEGQILRDPRSFYEHRRSSFLLKNKEFDDAEFEIIDVLEGKGNWANAAKTLIIRLENGEIQRSGVRGNFDMLKDLLYKKEEYIGTDVTVRYQGKTSDDKLRFPVAIKFWKEKRTV
jgi:ATP-dependent DNA ligase